MVVVRRGWVARWVKKAKGGSFPVHPELTMREQGWVESKTQRLGHSEKKSNVAVRDQKKKNEERKKKLSRVAALENFHNSGK